MRILGIDITENAVRGTWISTSMRKVQVERYVELPYANPQTQSAEATSTAPLALVLQELITTETRSPDVIVTALEGTEVSIREVSIPKGAMKRIHEVLPFELESQIPFDIDEAIIDHQIIEESSTEVRLLAVAAQHETIAKHLEALQRFNVQPRELTAGPVSLSSLTWLNPALETPGPNWILDIRDRSTDICVLSEGRCQLARTLSLGMDAVVSGRLPQLEAEIRRTMTGYRLKGGHAPAACYLAGASANDAQARSWLGSLFEAPCHEIPLPETDGSEPSLAKFARATALASSFASREKSINLRKGAFASAHNKSGLRPYIKAISIAAACIFATFSFSSLTQYFLLSSEQEHLQERLKSVTSQLFGKATDDPTRARLFAENGPGSDDPLPKFDAFAVLTMISDEIPANAEHDIRRLDIEIGLGDAPGKLKLDGEVVGSEEAEVISEILAKHPCLKEVKQGSISRAREGRMQYELTAKIECNEGENSDE
jgi:general secretion pathway protein L